MNKIAHASGILLFAIPGSPLSRLRWIFSLAKLSYSSGYFYQQR
jgi:hypothetical protein